MRTLAVCVALFGLIPLIAVAAALGDLNAEPMPK